MNLRRSLILFILMALLAFNHYNYSAGAAGGTPSPGTGGDPLVTKSYLEGYLGQAVGELKEQLAYLRGETKKIDERIKRLEARLIQPIILTLGQREARQGDTITQLAKAPYIKEGRTMLPFRFIGEAMGAQVSWEGETRQAVFKGNSQTVRLTIGSTQAELNGTLMELDAAPELVDSVTMVPLRFVADGLGARIEWLPEQKQVIIHP